MAKRKSKRKTYSIIQWEHHSLGGKFKEHSVVPTDEVQTTLARFAGNRYKNIKVAGLTGLDFKKVKVSVSIDK